MIRWLTVCKWHWNVLLKKEPPKSNRTKIYSPCLSSFFTCYYAVRVFACFFEAETVEPGFLWHTHVQLAQFILAICCLCYVCKKQRKTFHENVFVFLQRMRRPRYSKDHSNAISLSSGAYLLFMPMFAIDLFAILLTTSALDIKFNLSQTLFADRISKGW